MPLEDLLVKVKEEKNLEIEKMKEDLQKDFKFLDQKFGKELQEIESELEKDFQKKKESLLKKKEREYFFKLKMKELELKKELFEEVKQKVLLKLETLSFEDKKKIYLKRLEEEKSFLEESSDIFVSKGKKEKLEPIIKSVGIKKDTKELDFDFGEGFLVKGDRWTLSITLEEILNKEIDKNKKEFIDLLFKGL